MEPRGASCDSSRALGPQPGSQQCVGEVRDGERTHRCHRRCGDRGQVPLARSWRGSRMWMDCGWSVHRRMEGVHADRSSPDEFGCTQVLHTLCTRSSAGNPALSGILSDRTRREGVGRPAHVGEEALVAGSVDDVGRVGRVHATPGYPQRCPQAVDLWTTPMTRGPPRAKGGWCPATSRCGISGRTGGENPVDIHR